MLFLIFGEAVVRRRNAGLLRALQAVRLSAIADDVDYGGVRDGVGAASVYQCLQVGAIALSIRQREEEAERGRALHGYQHQNPGGRHGW